MNTPLTEARVREIIREERAERHAARMASWPVSPDGTLTKTSAENVSLSLGKGEGDREPLTLRGDGKLTPVKPPLAKDRPTPTGAPHV